MNLEDSSSNERVTTGEKRSINEWMQVNDGMLWRSESEGWRLEVEDMKTGADASDSAKSKMRVSGDGGC